MHITHHDENDGNDCDSDDDDEGPDKTTMMDRKEAGDADSNDDPLGIKTSHKKMTLLLADVSDVNQTSKHVVVEPCAICLTEYTEGEILCSSQNDHCKHVFHRDCMEMWLLRQEGCPICRNNYLGLEGDEEYYAELHEEEQQQLRLRRDLFLTNALGSTIPTTPGLPLGPATGGGGGGNASSLGMLGSYGSPSASALLGLAGGSAGAGVGSGGFGLGTNSEGTPADRDDASAFLRGMHLYYLLSRLAETRGPNTTIRLEGLELGGGRPLNLEIEGGPASNMAVASNIHNNRNSEQQNEGHIELQHQQQQTIPNVGQGIRRVGSRLGSSPAGGNSGSRLIGAVNNPATTDNVADSEDDGVSVVNNFVENSLPRPGVDAQTRDTQTGEVPFATERNEEPNNDGHGMGNLISEDEESSVSVPSDESNAH